MSAEEDHRREMIEFICDIERDRHFDDIHSEFQDRQCVYAAESQHGPYTLLEHVVNGLPKVHIALAVDSLHTVNVQLARDDIQYSQAHGEALEKTIGQSNDTSGVFSWNVERTGRKLLTT